MALPLRIAVEGCGHGTLNAIYDSIKKSCHLNKWPGIDLLIIGGDFQAVRNMQDLNIMSCPPKYRALGDFHDYYSGKKRAPYLTLFVGGNHEASSHLWELYYGGWAAPNIYYLGASSILNFRGLRIAGLSGIYNSHDYARTHHERLPYTYGDIKSVYHVRAYDMFKLYQSREQIDVMISHDWPQGIEFNGDLEGLLKKKPWFQSDIDKGELGSPPGRSLLYKLKPRYWFSAHMHIKFSAIVDHQEGGEGMKGGGDAEPAQVARKQDTYGEWPRSGETDTAESRGNDRHVKNPDELEIDLDLDLDDSDGGVVVQPKNSDEIELDLDDEPANLPPAATAAVSNSDEIATDVDDDEPKTAAISNSDEISLDLDEDEPSNPTATAAVSNPDETATDADDDEPKTAATSNSDETALDLDKDEHSNPTTTATDTPQQTANTNRYTRFLALDKCLPRRDFLQILTITPNSPPLTTASPTGLTYDPEWLTITRTLNPYLHNPPSHPHSSFRIPSQQALIAAEIAKQREWVETNIVAKGLLGVPENFIAVAPTHRMVPESKWGEGPEEYESPQTRDFCMMLGIENGTVESEEGKARRMVKVRERLAREDAGGGGGRGGGRDGGGRGGGGRDGGGRGGGGRGGGGYGSGRGRGGGGRGRGGGGESSGGRRGGRGGRGGS